VAPIGVDAIDPYHSRIVATVARVSAIIQPTSVSVGSTCKPLTLEGRM